MSYLLHATQDDVPLPLPPDDGSAPAAASGRIPGSQRQFCSCLICAILPDIEHLLMHCMHASLPAFGMSSGFAVWRAPTACQVQ